MFGVQGSVREIVARLTEENKPVYCCLECSENLDIDEDVVYKGDDWDGRKCVFCGEVMHY